MDDLGEYVDQVIARGKNKVDDWHPSGSPHRKAKRLKRERKYLLDAQRYMRSVSPRKQKEFLEKLAAGATVQPETGLERTPTGLFKRIRKDVSALIRGLVK